MKISKYVELYGSVDEKRDYHELWRWVGAMLSKRALAQEIMTIGIGFSGPADRRQMRVDKQFFAFGGHKLLKTFRNNAHLLSCWPLKEKCVKLNHHLKNRFLQICSQLHWQLFSK